MTTPAIPNPFVDVRMRGFRDRADVADVLHMLEARVTPLGREMVPLAGAARRVLAAAVVSMVNVPGFTRAAMDGYAVRAADTTGAGPGHPVRLTVVGEAYPGRPCEVGARPGQAIRTMTGAPLSVGADAVVMAEYATEEPGGCVCITAPVVVGRNVGQIGEDVAAGHEVLSAGRVLRPQDVGLLASIGVGAVEVVQRPRVAVLVTGDELLPPGSTPEGFRIVDSNSPMLAALIARDGGTCLPIRYVSDQYKAIRDAIREVVEGADIVLVSGGSSVGKEDHAPRVLAGLGELAIHGVAVRPAAPLGVGFVVAGATPGHTRPVFLLPGNPVACLCGYDLFTGRVVRRLGGRSWGLPYRRLSLPLASAVASAVGRVDYLRVRVDSGAAHPIATSGGSILSSTVAADGFVLIDRDRERYQAGEVVEVWMYDAQMG